MVTLQFIRGASAVEKSTTEVRGIKVLNSVQQGNKFR